MEKDLSQYLHLYGCSPVCVRRCRVRLAERGNILPQNLHVYLPGLRVGVVVELADEEVPPVE